MRQVQNVTIDADSAGQRLDNFLIGQLKGLPRSRIYRMIRKGEVRINGKRVRPESRLAISDRVRIPPIAHLPERSAAVGRLPELDLITLYEDEDLLVVNKPAGMAVHGGSGVSVGLIESLRAVHPTGSKLELIHRLDRGTSGAVMVAKRRQCLKQLQEALRKPGTIKKHYLALVEGVWPSDLERIEQPLLTTNHKGQERFTRVNPDGKPAVTEFRCLGEAADCSLLEASPLTGRTHQIRVHARWARHPLVGDERYGQGADKDRLMLHAVRLQIPALAGIAAVEITAPLDESFHSHLESTLSNALKRYLNQ